MSWSLYHAPPEGGKREKRGSLPGTLDQVRRQTREHAKNPRNPVGFYWIEDERGVPFYTARAYDWTTAVRVFEPFPPGDERHGSSGSVHRVPDHPNASKEGYVRGDWRDTGEKKVTRKVDGGNAAWCR